MSEKLARKFHEVYERLAPSHGYKTREETREFDPKSPNGSLMIRVCGEVCGEQQDEIKRLRGLLRRSVPYISRPEPSRLRRQLIDRIEREVSDES